MSLTCRVAEVESQRRLALSVEGLRNVDEKTNEMASSESSCVVGVALVLQAQ